jgi:hypothetical protein
MASLISSREGPGIAGQERRRGHQHAGRAEATLASSHPIEAVEQGIHVGRAVEALHRGDLLAVRLDGEGEARERDAAVHEHRTRAAITLVAALFGADEIEVVTQRFEQRAPRRHGEAQGLPPMTQRDRHQRLSLRRLRETHAIGPGGALLALIAWAYQRMIERDRSMQRVGGELHQVGEIVRAHPRSTGEPEVVQQQLEVRVAHPLADAEHRAVHAIDARGRRPERRRQGEAAIVVRVPVEPDVGRAEGRELTTHEAHEGVEAVGCDVPVVSHRQRRLAPASTAARNNVRNMLGGERVVSSVTSVNESPWRTASFVASVTDFTRNSVSQPSHMWRIGELPMNAYTSMGRPARSEARAMPTTSATTVRAAPVGMSGSLASRISRQSRYASSDVTMPAAGSPTLTTFTPARERACKRSIFCAMGGFSADTLCRPSRSVSSTTATVFAQSPKRAARASPVVPGGAPWFQS